jgi:hypothetical protein
MTTEKAIEFGKIFLKSIEDEKGSATYEFVEMAVKALKGKDILDKIRAEILEEKEWAYADFERYKVEYLGQDWEDALDSLPQDDFRYGMERCVDIIDKYNVKARNKYGRYRIGH